MVVLIPKEYHVTGQPSGIRKELARWVGKRLEGETGRINVPPEET
jgi:hypothetical protein